MDSSLQPAPRSALSGRSLPTREALDDALAEQQQMIAQQSIIMAEQQKRLVLLEEQIRLLRSKRFGRSSEQSTGQLPLFDEDESPGESPAAAPQPPESSKKKRRGGRKGLSADLPRQTIYLRLSDEEKAGAIETFVVKVKEELDIRPAKVQVLEYLQEKAVFVEAGTRRLVEAERPRHPLGKAVVSVAFLAYLIVAKYCDALPLYRLEGIFTRYGGSVTRTTLSRMADPVIAAAAATDQPDA